MKAIKLLGKIMVAIIAIIIVFMISMMIVNTVFQDNIPTLVDDMYLFLFIFGILTTGVILYLF